MTTTPTLWLNEQQANTTDSGPHGDLQFQPQIISLTNGNFVVLWGDFSNAGPGSLSFSPRIRAASDERIQNGAKP